MPWQRYGTVTLTLAILAAIAGLSQVSYLLFHAVVELTGVVVALGIFTLAWNLRRTLDNNYLMVMGIASIALGVFDLLHTLAYKGMGVFPEFTANLPTQLHIAGRYLQAATLIAAPFFVGRKVRAVPAMATYVLAAAGLIALVFGGWFPTCYIDGVGLTPFKKISEYVIALGMIAGMALLWSRRRLMDRTVLYLLLGSVGLTILGELAFTVYVGVYDWLNMSGHLIRLAAVYLLYVAVVQTGLSRPFDLLFWNLKRSEEALQQERNFVARVLDMAGAPLVVVNAQGRIVRFNRACEELAGFTADEVSGKVMWDLFLPADERETAQAVFRHIEVSQAESTLECHWVTRANEYRLLAWTCTPLRGKDGSIEYVTCSGVDVTAQRQMENDLKEREERLRVMVESVKTGMLLVDRTNHTVVSANPAMAALVGLPERELAGRPCSDFFKCAGAGAACPFDAGEGVGPEAMLRTAAGREIPVHRSVAAVVTDGREHLLESVVDMSEHKRLEEELRALSMVDELTGLYNRRGFLTLAPREIESALRVRGGMLLLFVDVDNLKEVNDRFGHAEGDRALQAMTRVLREAFREAGLIARTGADEFAVLMTHFAGTNPTLLMRRLEEHLEAYNCTVRGAYELRAGIGYARMSPDRPCSAVELLTQADNMLYLERRRRLSH
jgi:diguanylate cyclase (GGDEF)-like protein/PAS domain S-box-containing protein